MQLLPGTARDVAGRLGVPFIQDKLTRDPAYNVQLGSQYLTEMLQRFGGSYEVALAAYNAGPNRVARWLESMGDPRTGKIDMVDWIEDDPLPRNARLRPAHHGRRRGLPRSAERPGPHRAAGAGSLLAQPLQRRVRQRPFFDGRDRGFEDGRGSSSRSASSIRRDEKRRSARQAPSGCRPRRRAPAAPALGAGNIGSKVRRRADRRPSCMASGWRSVMPLKRAASQGTDDNGAHARQPSALVEQAAIVQPRRTGRASARRRWG